MSANRFEYFYTPSDDAMACSLYVTWAGRAQYGADSEDITKTLGYYLLLYVEEGEGFICQDGNEVKKVSKGSVAVLFPGGKCRLSSDAANPWTLVWVGFGGVHAGQFLSSLQISEQQCTVDGLLPDRTAHIMDAMLAAVGEERDKNRFAAMGYFLILLGEIGQARSKESKRRNEICREQIIPVAVRFIEQHYYTHLDVDLLCKHVNYSRSYLSRLFNDQTGMTIPEYINHVRVRHARELLEKTTLSVQEVSASVGVKDSFYFSKTFKKITGYAPNHYKKKFGNAAQKKSGGDNSGNAAV